jgi:hypothetical protein
MRAVAIVLSLSICAMDFLTAPAIASVMDGKGSPGSFRGERARDKAFGKLKKNAAGEKTCSSYAKICRRNNANSPACQTSYSNCMATGVFVGPKGATFSGMTRQ